MDQKIYEEFEQIEQNRLGFLVEIKKNTNISLNFSIVVKAYGDSFTKLRPLKETIKRYSLSKEYQYIVEKAELIAKKYGYKLVINSEITVYGD